MIKTSYINPFSDDAKEIVSKLGQIEDLDKENESLINIVNHTMHQQLEKIPLSVKQLALSKFEWYLFRKTDDFDDKQFEYLFNPEIYEYDVVSFYLLCQAVSIGFGKDSHEAKLVVELERDLIDQRFDRIKNEIETFQPEFLRETLNQLIDTNNVYWTDLMDILDLGVIGLDNLLLSNGKVIIEFEDFVEECGYLIEGRSPKSVYEVTLGLDLKIKLLKSFIMLNTKKYIDTVYEKSDKMVEPNPFLLDLSDKIKEIEFEATQARYHSKSQGFFDDAKPVSFDIDSFPPCVRKCLEGIKSGGRNDAIVLFLTPFVSYARLAPGIFSNQIDMKVSQVDPSLEITNNEIIPMIYDAAQSCSPPLFKDQPQEKININSKLGFGMHSELKLDNEGQTGWYTPMSCEKIKLHMPNLCIPNKDCKRIGNPLTYYNRKRRLNERNNKKQVKNNGD